MPMTTTGVSGCLTFFDMDYNRGSNNCNAKVSRRRHKPPPPIGDYGSFSCSANNPSGQFVQQNSAKSSYGSSKDSLRNTEDSDDEQHPKSGNIECSSEIGSPPRNFISSPDREVNTPQSVKAGNSPDLNGKICFGYQFFGIGNNYYAWNPVTNEQKFCTIVKRAEYDQIMKVRQRLNDAGKYWKYEDVAHLSDFVLPNDTEIYEWERGQYLFLSPWQYGSLDVNFACDARKNKVEKVLRILLKQIVRGIAFCHALGIMVRDLKPKKFVFANEEKTILRLRDVLGLYICEDVNNDIMIDHHGVPAYVAPEVLRRVPVEYAGKPADIWALGVLLFYLLYGKHPFSDSTLPRVFMRICRVSFCIPQNVYISQPVRILINGIFKKEPSERPTAEQLLNLRWFSDKLDPTSTLYLACRPCFVTGVANTRLNFSVVNNSSDVGRSNIMRGYRRYRNVLKTNSSPSVTKRCRQQRACYFAIILFLYLGYIFSFGMLSVNFK